jgi:glucuronokinase
MPVFESLDDLYKVTRWRGYYGGIRIIQALLIRFMDYCREEGIELENRNFTIEYETTIPLRLGMGGSSSIITAALRALCQYFGVEIPLPVQAKLVWDTENEELAVPSGPQDRVIQVYEGLVYMDFQEKLMNSRGYGEYEPLDPALLPNLYLAFRTSLSEGTEIFHNRIRQRWNSGDPEIVEAMKTWANFAVEGREALKQRHRAAFERLIDANFDLRAKIYKIARPNLEMVETARREGACAKFAGSGGAIIGTYADETMYQRLQSAFAAIGVGIVKPEVVPAAKRGSRE